MTESTEHAPKKTKKPVATATVIGGILLLLAFLFRNCLGFGTGTDDSSATPDAQPTLSTAGDAGSGATLDATAAVAPCIVKLDSQGIWLDGKAAQLPEVVSACRRAGRVSMDVTGGVHTGTYNDLVRALRDAGVKGVPEPDDL